MPVPHTKLMTRVIPDQVPKHNFSEEKSEKRRSAIPLARGDHGDYIFGNLSLRSLLWSRPVSDRSHLRLLSIIRHPNLSAEHTPSPLQEDQTYHSTNRSYDHLRIRDLWTANHQNDRLSNLESAHLLLLPVPPSVLRGGNDQVLDGVRECLGRRLYDHCEGLLFGDEFIHQLPSSQPLHLQFR